MKFKYTENAKTLMQANRLLIESGAKVPTLDFTPKRGTSNSSGYDLFACLDKELSFYPGETKLIGTGVHIYIGSDTDILLDLGEGIILAGQLMPRSSTKGLFLTNAVGLCDMDYQGEYMLSLHNYSNTVITITPGQRLAQLIFIFTYLPELNLVEEFKESTTRGTNGFGHTGE